MIRSLILLVAASLACCAAESCPWINAGTAAGILGGAVETKVTQDRCEFECRGGDRLSVEVEIMTNPPAQFTKYLSACKSRPVPLKAIGNETVTCGGRHAGLAIGRVRDRAFIIRVTTKDRSATSETLESKAQEAARHVAGNLF
jgi:hypothetical protein